MKIITTRGVRNEAKTYFELAEKEHIVTKRGKKFVNLVVSNKPDSKFFNENLAKEFLAIPEKSRCNPFDISPGGDLYWADKRNVDSLKDSIKNTTKEEKTMYDDNMKRKWDNYAVMDYAVETARKEGKAEGLAEGEARGIAEGEAKGKAEGLAEGKIEIARSMKRDGLPAGQIARFTGLSVEEIEKL